MESRNRACGGAAARKKNPAHPDHIFSAYCAARHCALFSNTLGRRGGEKLVVLQRRGWRDLAATDCKRFCVANRRVSFNHDRRRGIRFGVWLLVSFGEQTRPFDPPPTD
jgi:hypothetical protein